MQHTTFTVDQARTILQGWAAQGTWRHRGAALRMEVTALRSLEAHQLTYEQFFETRAVAPATRPYAGGPLDGPDHGPPPDPWHVTVPDTRDFHPTEFHLPLPHTSTVHVCHRCAGAGRHACERCNGTTRIACPTCEGTGRARCDCGTGSVTCAGCNGAAMITETTTVTDTSPEGVTSTRFESTTTPCSSCSGSGRQTCSTCGGGGSVPCAGCSCFGHVRCPACDADGSVQCGPCAGHGQLEAYQQLTVRRHHVTHTRSLDAAALPEACMREALGVSVLEQCDTSLSPAQVGASVGAAPLRDDVAAEARALLAQNALRAGEKPLRARLRVTAVPVHMGEYVWGGRPRRFYVYGLDARVHAPDFPVAWTRVAGAILAALAVGGALVGAVAALVS